MGVGREQFVVVYDNSFAPWMFFLCLIAVLSFPDRPKSSICMFVGVSCVTNIWGGCVQQMLRGASDILQNALGGSENIWRTWCSALILTSMVLLMMSVRVCVSSAPRPSEFYIIYRFPPAAHLSSTRWLDVKMSKLISGGIAVPEKTDSNLACLEACSPTCSFPFYLCNFYELQGFRDFASIFADFPRLLDFSKMFKDFNSFS